MEKEYFCRRLPEQLPKGLISWAKRNLSGDLGGDYTVFKSDRIRIAPDLQELMDNQIEGRSVWAAYCTCTACGESYHKRKVPGLNAFYISQRDDGVTYPTRMDAELEDYWDIEVAPNDQINCPMCGCNTTVIHARNLRGGRTKQVQVATLHAIDGYAVIVYWLVRNNIQEYGCCYGAVPRYAFALGERGGITAYSHRWNGVFGKDVPASRWRPLEKNYDRWDNRYHDWGSINDTKVGTFLYPQELPSLIGTTGEKTGLLAYWESGNNRPVQYLKLWKRWKPVENLVNSGFSDLVANAVNCGYYDPEYGPKVELGKILDTSKRKPHEILYMSKADFRTISQWKNKPSRWKFELWAKYRNIPGKLGAADFFREVDAFSDNGMRAAIDVMKEYGDCDLDKLRRYLEKQGHKPREVQLLKDTRAMCRELSGRQELTQEERWPRRLLETHDRLTAQRRLQEDAAKAAEYQKGFDQVLETYGAIQWTDKDLAIILPKCNEDLVREGDVLRHCVGGYGGRHSKGQAIILFVRHYRRPERCYYTLNVDFSGSEPKEIQLHGYGNERHGDHKQYCHNIPKKVRQFVDRWEQEVLLPWWREQQKNQNKERKTA